MSSFVLDASVVLAILTRETGSEYAKSLMDGTSVMSTVNHTEVIARLQDRGWGEAEIEDTLSGAAWLLIPFAEDQAADAGYLRHLTRHLGLSLGDRACLALAREMGLPVLTADRTWSQLDVGVDVRLIR